MDNLGKMDKFLETYNLAKLNQEEEENLNGLITMNEIEAVIKLLAHKSPGPDGFKGEFYQLIKGQLSQNLLKGSRKFKNTKNLQALSTRTVLS